MVVLDGTVSLETGAGVEPLEVGDAVLLDRRTAHRVIAAQDSKIVVADLRPVVRTAVLSEPLVARDFAGRHPGIFELVRACPQGAERHPSSYAALIGAAMTESVVRREHERDGAADPAVRTVVESIAGRPGEPWTVERMARLVHLSRSALTERFRRELDQTPTDVLRDVRMHVARRLLGDATRSVEEIGRSVGYGSAAAFSRAFAAHHGTSPRGWRESAARNPQQTEADPPRHRHARTGEAGGADVVRIHDRAATGRAERDRHLERSHLQRQS